MLLEKVTKEKGGCEKSLKRHLVIFFLSSSFVQCGAVKVRGRTVTLIDQGSICMHCLIRLALRAYPALDQVCRQVLFLEQLASFPSDVAMNLIAVGASLHGSPVREDWPGCSSHRC